LGARELTAGAKAGPEGAACAVAEDEVAGAGGAGADIEAGTDGAEAETWAGDDAGLVSVSALPKLAAR